MAARAVEYRDTIAASLTLTLNPNPNPNPNPNQVEYRDTIAASLPRAPSMDVWAIASEEGPGTTTPASAPPGWG